MANPPNDTEMLRHTDAERALVQRLEGIRASHPRLHFDPEGRDQLRRRTAGTHNRYARLLFDWVEGSRDWSPPVELPDSALNEVVLEQW